MASQTYSVEEKNLMRLSCIYHKVTTGVLRYVFRYGSSDRLSPDKPPNMSLVDYYSSKGINSFRSSLSKDQKPKFDTDFQGDTFDITLLYKCLRWGSHGLAQDNDDKWNKGDGASIESLITIVKNKRNKLAHEQPMYTTQQLFNEAKDVEEALTKILQFSEHLFNIPTATINQEISNVKKEVREYQYDDFDPKSFEEYKKQLFFDAQSEYLNDEGLKETQNQYIQCLEDQVSTTNHVVPNLSLPVEVVYTEMILKGKLKSGGDKPIKYENVLQDNKHKKITDSVIVVNGPAGAGKTTLTKKMILDFIKKINTMEELLNHDHLLTTECRNTLIHSFVDMLRHRMPNVSQHFKEGDLTFVMLAQKVLVVLDGLDELNTASAELFEELLKLNSEGHITLMITTRPEKMKYIEERLNSHNLKMKHIQLMGIPAEKRDEMVTKYHSAIEMKYNVSRDIQGLLTYLKKTEHRLGDLWRLPYNLTLVTILWTHAFMDVENITTAPELYREILQLYISRLKERLASNEATPHSQESEQQAKINSFLYNLAREALIGLINNHINLPQEAYDRLAESCRCIKIPIEEMISAFLKPIPSADAMTYGFAHKGMQDYLAAYYIWLIVTEKARKQEDVQKKLDDLGDCLRRNHFPKSAQEKTLRYMKSELIKKPTQTGTLEDLGDYLRQNFPQSDAENLLRASENVLKKKPKQKGMLARIAAATLRPLVPSHKADGATSGQPQPSLEASSSLISEILNEMPGYSQEDFTKFQNCFKSLLGMFYSEKDVVIDEDIKLEALKLLQDTGIESRDDWITILNSIKCDSYVVNYISQQPDVLEGYIAIDDTSLDAYIALLKAMKTPLKDAHKVTGVKVAIMGDLSGDHEGNNDVGITSVLFEEIARHILPIDSINLVHNFRDQKSAATLSEEELNAVFKRCLVERYTGRMTPSMLMPRSMTYLEVSVSDLPSYQQLQRFLNTQHQLDGLGISVANQKKMDKLTPLPYVGSLGPSLFLPDIGPEDLHTASNIKRLNPMEGKKEFGWIFFPRLRLKGDEIKTLFSQMEMEGGIKIHGAVHLPTSCAPDSTLRADLEEHCRRTLHCVLLWGSGIFDSGDIEDMDSW